MTTAHDNRRGGRHGDVPAEGAMTPAAVARSHALQSLATHASDQAAVTRGALTRSLAPDDREYLTTMATEYERLAARLRDAPGYLMREGR